MPDDAPDSYHVPRKPDWLEETTLRAMEQVVYRELAFGKDAARVRRAAREVALAHLPAAPMRMIEEAVNAAIPDPQGPAAMSVGWRGEQLREATGEEVTASLSYALCFDHTGKARRTGHEYQSTLAARQLLIQLELSGYVVMKRPPERKPRGPRLTF